MENKTTFRSIDEYIAIFLRDEQVKLKELRVVIQSGAPGAKEKISYQMPTFFLEGNLVHFAAYKNHIGFYPTPSGIQAYQQELLAYKSSKGAVQFPLDQPISYELVAKIVKYRVTENLKKGAEKRKKE